MQECPLFCCIYFHEIEISSNTVTESAFFVHSTRSWVEAADRGWKTTIHRRSEKAPGDAHEGAPGLQVPAQEETEANPTWRVSLSDDVSLRAGRRAASRLVIKFYILHFSP